MDSSHKFLKGLSGEAGGALTGLQGKNLSRPEVRLVGTFVCVSSFSFPWDSGWSPFLISVQSPDHP